ncbi:hypothetical protein BD410DRAFT_648774 [Rickenella mellea]|uniref:Uncharacterized protein n=1 Tax=Rickenella mellea TaxID=50990 RepID=A0A4Y7PM52_9AGAM|nr:hypothetical protein BD410DRAFT_648774 [Rickenella mellea]
MGTYLWLHLSPSHLDSSFPPRVYMKQTLVMPIRSIGQCLTLVFDFAVFSLTFAKTIRHTIEMRQLGLGEGLGYYILRDGIVYFFFQMFIHAAIITVYNVGVGKGVTWEGEISTIGNTLVVNMACRLVLNLRQVSRTPHLRTTFGGVGTVVEEPAFATNPLLGNIGASLRIGPEDDTISVDEVIPLDDLDEPPIHSHDEIKSS